MTLGLARFEADSGKAVAIATRDAARLARSQDQFLSALEKEAAVVGKTRAEILSMRAAQLQLGDSARAYIDKIASTSKAGIGAKEIAAGTATATVGLKSAGEAAEHFGFQTAGAKRELLVLAHELSQGNYSRFGGSLLVLGERTGAASLLFSGLGIAAIATAGAVGGVVAALVAGTSESKAFANSLQVTGNFAGTTASQFVAMSAAIAQSTGQGVGKVRDILQGLVSTGDVGPRLIGPIATAVATLEKLTGEKGEDIVKDFAKMGDGVAKFALEHNKSFNFITADQYAYIKRLEEQGHKEEAEIATLDALNAHLGGALPKNLGLLERAWKSLGETATETWDAMKGVGRAATVDDEIAKQVNRIDAARLAATARPVLGSSGLPKFDAGAAEDSARDDLRLAKLAKRVQATSALSSAESAATEKARIAAVDYIAKIADETKGTSLATREIEKYRKQVELLKGTQSAVSAADQSAQEAAIRKRYTGTSGASDGDAQRKSDLAKALQGYAEELAKETDALKFHQSELQAIYSAGKLSLVQFYDDKAKTTADGVRAEIAAQDKATARLNAELTAGKFKDPHERTDTEKQRNESIAKSANLARDADHGAALAVYERAAAVKVLAQQVDSFAANLLQLEGDDAGAAALRATATLEATKLLQKKASGSANPITDSDVAREERAIKLRDALAQVSGRVSIATADATRSEEVFLLLATRGGADLATQDQGLLKIRTKLVDQLGEAARKTQELAEAAIAAAKVSGGVVDPKVLTEAANAARDYIVALNNVDPAYKRLQDAGNALGTSIADTLGGAIAKFTSLKDAARSVGHQIFESLTKQFVTAPLEKQIQGILGKIIDGDNPVSAALRSAAGAQDTGVRAAQTAAITASTNALVAFSNAANAATYAFGPSGVKFTGSSTDPSAVNYENSSDQSNSAAEAAKSLGAFGKTTTTTADLFTGAVSTLVSSTGKAGAAIAGLPGVISNVSSYVYSLLSSASSSSSASGAAALIGKFFGGGSGSSVGSSASYAANDFIAAANGHAFSTSGVQAFARGDVFNTPTAFRFARGGGFSNGVMGEAGPEAVMPLRRGADGKLGVASAGGSNANVYYINVTTEAAPNMSRDTALQQGANIGAGIQRALARNG